MGGRGNLEKRRVAGAVGAVDKREKAKGEVGELEGLVGEVGALGAGERDKLRRSVQLVGKEDERVAWCR